jgi:hypothetical protein
MKMSAVLFAAAALVASVGAVTPSAHAGQFNNNMKLSNGPGPGPYPHPGPKPGLSSHPYGFHGHHHGSWGPAGLAVGLVGLSSAAMAADDCFYVRRKVFVPGVGLVRRRELVCG